jgi:hypothetical protein
MTGAIWPDCWQWLLLANTALVWGAWWHSGPRKSRVGLGLAVLAWLLICAGVAVHCNGVWLSLSLLMPPALAVVLARALRGP